MSASQAALDLRASRGLRVLYRRHSGAVCPGCGASAWHVGRTSAECDRCGTALLLAEPGGAENPLANPTERKSR